MKILSLNTWQECGLWEKRWEIIFSGLERFQPDLVGFQEVFNPDWAKQIKKRTGFPFMVFSSAPSGLLVLSRFPVQDWCSYQMKAKSPTENYFRYALFAEIEMNKNRVAVFNTHLSWKLDEGDIREKQIGELLTFMNEKAQNLETLAMGDFNAPPKTPEIKKMLAEGKFTDSFASLYLTQAGLTWDNRNEYAAGSNHPLPDRRIDYLFIRNAAKNFTGLKSVEVIFNEPNAEGVFASDHFGVLASFKQ